jgi:ATPase
MSKKIVPDTSIIIDRKLSQMVEKGEFGDEIKDLEIVIPAAVLDELQSQASRGREHGFVGLEELKTLRKLGEEKGFKLRFTGTRPTLDDIRLAKAGRMDAIIRDVAKHEGAEFYTADYVQGLVGEVEGVKTHYISKDVKTEALKFEDFFDERTISVHLKEGVKPKAKRGEPGKFELTTVGDNELTKEDMERIIKEIDDATYADDKSSVAINRRGALVIQFGQFRIAIARPPFSDGIEVTIVRPIVKMSLEDYKLSDKLMARMSEKAEGVIIAGPPGSGKTTLASGVAEFYTKKGKIVKTLESPRDLQVGPEITQYAPLEGSFEKTADILLLVRPDYSIFDEVRKTNDFKVFADMRLSGIGLVGVVHASKAIDAVQRFMGKIELGVIPHVVDTIIFVQAGEIKKVYELSMAVKVPSGMTESDLARPVVVVKDFETGKLEYEIYTFGEENVVMPVQEQKQMQSGAKKLAADMIRSVMRKYDARADVEILSENSARVRVDNKVIAKVIGKEGKNVNKLQDMLGMHLDIEPKIAAIGKEIRYDYRESGNTIEFIFKKRHVGDQANVYVDDDFLFSAMVGKKGKIKVTKKSEIGKEIVKALVTNKKIKVMV